MGWKGWSRNEIKQVNMIIMVQDDYSVVFSKYVLYSFPNFVYEVFRTFKGIEFQILEPTKLVDCCNRLVLYKGILKWFIMML